MHTAVRHAIEAIDCALFNSAIFFQGEDRAEFVRYLDRWRQKASELDPGSDDKPRKKEPNDYDRPQPTKDDEVLVEEFIRKEAGLFTSTLLNSQFSRKLGLLVAAKFNQGYEAGLRKARGENGFSEGYNSALRLCQRAIEKIGKMRDT